MLTRADIRKNDETASLNGSPWEVGGREHSPRCFASLLDFPMAELQSVLPGRREVGGNLMLDKMINGN